MNLLRIKKNINERRCKVRNDIIYHIYYISIYLPRPQISLLQFLKKSNPRPCIFFHFHRSGSRDEPLRLKFCNPRTQSTHPSPDKKNHAAVRCLKNHKDLKVIWQWWVFKFPFGPYRETSANSREDNVSWETLLSDTASNPSSPPHSTNDIPSTVFQVRTRSTTQKLRDSGLNVLKGGGCHHEKQ